MLGGLRMIFHEEFTMQRAIQENPLAITKAVDFTDSQINTMWVDWPAEGGFAELMNVRSPMARIISGGKGTGRTHVMRHFSAPVQAIRGDENPIMQVIQDGVLGIYVRCSGLNSSRFRGRGQNDETWQSVFSQYADVWLGQAALEAFNKVTEASPPSESVQSAIAKDVMKLLNTTREHSEVNSLVELRGELHDLQRSIDLAVNNAALNPDDPLGLAVQSTPGTLVFGIPRAIQRHYMPLRETICLYLIDEFENFDVPQQQYVNSLIRDKSPGTSFMIGVRTYGLRTLSTLGGGEDNKRGSEFDEIRPDRTYIGPEGNMFVDFCRKVVGRRLVEYGFMDDTDPEYLQDRLGEFFEELPDDYEENQIRDRYKGGKPPYLSRLEDDLAQAGYADITAGEQRAIDFILEATRVPTRPLLEKINVFLIYRAWSKGEDLTQVARKLIAERFSPDESGLVTPNSTQQKVLNHYVTDMKAQLCNDRRSRQMYAGIEQFIMMSDGLPRNLLVILKNIYRWALFNGERPFRGQPISLESQRLGVYESAEWFFADAKPHGVAGEHVHAAISRLGDMFRRFRFSDKPVESSLASFSADLTRCSHHAREVIELAEQWALLVRVDEGQKQRNTQLMESKFHLNRLLSPRWDLPIARRGAVALRPDEVNAVFDPDHAELFLEVLNRRLERMNVPFGRHREEGTAPKLFDLEL